MKVTNKFPVDWVDLQDKVCKFLNEAGYNAESPKTIETVRGKVEVDVFVTSELELIKQFICECKFWNTPVPKEKIHAFRSVVNDSGSMLGIFISKTGYQSGAYEAAYCSNVLLKDWEGFIELISNPWIEKRVTDIKLLSHPLSVYLDPLDIGYDDLLEKDKEQYKRLRDRSILAYMKCFELNRTLLKEEIIKIGEEEFCAMDELFDYLERIIKNTIAEFALLFKNTPIEKYKLDSRGYVMAALLRDYDL